MTKSIDNKWWVLIAVGTGSLMSSLDGSVVNIILPVLRDAFNSDVTTVEWIVTVYLLVLSGLLLTFGRLGDLRGHKTVYLWAFGIFVVSSIMCGSAWSTTSLIVFRGIQAVGGAMLASNAPAIITGNFPPEQRGRAFGLASTMTYLGLTIGPSLGGWLTETISWRSVFYINVPIGSLALILSLVFIPKDAPAAGGQRFDIPGALAFMAGLTSLMLGLNQGSEWGWGSPLVIGLLALAAVFLGVFIWIEKRSESPMLDLSLFRVPLFSASTAAAILNYIAIYSIIFLMPFYLIQGLGLNPARAGLILTAQPIIMAIAAPISGSFSDRFGSRKPGMIGMGVLAAGLLVALQTWGGQQSLDGHSRASAGWAGHRHVHLAQHQRPDGRRTQVASGDRLRSARHRPQFWDGIGDWSGRGDLHHPVGWECRRCFVPRHQPRLHGRGGDCADRRFRFSSQAGK